MHAVPCHTVPYRAIPSHAVHYLIISYRAKLYRTIWYRSMPYRVMPYRAIPCRAIPSHAIHTLPYHIVPCKTVPYYIVPFHAIPYGAITMPYQQCSLLISCLSSIVSRLMAGTTVKYRTADISSTDRSRSRYFRADRSSMPDLKNLTHVAGWEPYNMYDVGHILNSAALDFVFLIYGLCIPGMRPYKTLVRAIEVSHSLQI